MKISSKFDSGRIEIVKAKDPSDIQLKIDHDSHSEFRQWFHFRLQGAMNQACRIRLINAGESSYPKWEGYNIVASYDRETWFRVPTEFDGKQLLVKHTPEFNDVYYAYFAPYSFERHLNLIAYAQQSPICKVKDLGQTLDGHDLNLLVIGKPTVTKKKVWIIARQHPGETMAEWFIDGMLERLLDPDDAIAKQLLTQAVFYVVPNMNIDGSIRGNLRTNASGANLNREWLNPTMEKSPEVFLVREKMHQTGVDLFLDVHGDEQLPYNFLSGAEGVPSFSDKQKQLCEQFKAAFIRANPDMQGQYGYPTDRPNAGDLSMATNYVAEIFKAGVAYTIEMPFKDNASAPDETFGWSPERSQRLGASVLNPIAEVLPVLR